MSSTPVEPETSGGGIPTPLIVVGLAIATILGIVWTHHHRATKKDLSADDMINEINNKGANLRRQLREEQAAISRAQSRAAMTSAAVQSKLPSDIDESKISEMIEACSFFQNRVSVDVPRQFQANIYGLTLQNYPAMPMAIAEHLIEFDPPSFNASMASRYLPDPVHAGDLITVRITPSAYSKVDVSEEPTVYHFGLGRRRVEISRALPTSDSTISVSFTWTFDQNAASSIAPEGDDRNGGADLRRTASGWNIERAWQNSRRSTTNIGCQ